MNLLYIADIRDEQLLRGFADSGQRVVEAKPHEADWALADSNYGFILLDLQQAQPDLLERCVARKRKSRILVLLAEDNRQARVAALRGGAELCLTKPVLFIELQARMHALLRDHLSPAVDAEAGLWLSTTRLLLGRGAHQQPLTVSEQRLLAILAKRPGAVSRELIEEQLWGAAHDSRSALIERHICNLRRKLARLDAPNALQTLRGFGYSLRETVHVRTD
ncbi:winged helix family two component transcriptional regulator [Pseudomonas sp. M47T1]|uniref:response regulator transcription factor n=1 Tax=unclassified Pseudomonas TaxID=196821 RepID=UPI00026086A1|nr:response regulator transcription factor [Pseudomonas sp. M47T1]EIK93312.1 winged helix family two component transcriptional regulator [Pseudomonas sp. M47T1]